MRYLVKMRVPRVAGAIAPLLGNTVDPRLALGAQVGDIIRLVLGGGAKLALVGSAIGLLGAFGISRLLAALFPGMQTNSVLVLSGVTLLLIAVGLIAGYMPARYASRISPMEAMQSRRSGQCPFRRHPCRPAVHLRLPKHGSEMGIQGGAEGSERVRRIGRDLDSTPYQSLGLQAQDQATASGTTQLPRRRR